MKDCLRTGVLLLALIVCVPTVNGQTVADFIRQGSWLVGQDRFQEAEDVLSKALVLSASSDNRLMHATLLHRLGKLYGVKGEYHKAKEKIEEALEIRTQVKGTTSIEYAESLYALGKLSIAMASPADAIEHLKKSAAIRRKKLGLESPEYAEAINALGYCYILMHHPEEGKALCSKALKIVYKDINAGNPVYNDILKSLAKYYMIYQNYPEAESYYRMSIAYFSTHFGKGSAGYAHELLALTPSLIYQGKHDAADSLFTEVQTIYEKKNLSLSPNGLMLGYYKSLELICQGEYIQAERLLLDIWNYAAGHDLFTPSHFFYMDVSRSQAEVYGALEDFKNQEEALSTSFELRELAFGKDHPVTAEIYLDYGRYYLRMNNYDQAIENYLKAYNTSNKYNHVNLKIHASRGLGVVYHSRWNIQQQQRDYKLARAYYDDALNLQKTYIGEDNLLYLQIEAAGLFLFSSYESDSLVVEKYRKYLDRVKRYSVTAHIDVLSDYSSYLLECERYDEALSLLTTMIEQLKGMKGSRTLSEAIALIGIGNVMLETGDTQQAYSYFEESLEMIKMDAAKVLSFLAEEERESYWVSGRANTEHFKRLAYNNREKDACWGGLAYNNELFVKNLLLMSSTQILNLVKKSHRTEVKELWDSIRAKKLELFNLKDRRYPLPEEVVTEERVDKLAAMKASDELPEEINALEKRLLQLLKEEKGGLLLNSDLTWKDVQRTLLPYQAAVEFVCFEENNKEIYYALLLQSDSEFPQVIPCCSKEDLDLPYFYNRASLEKLYSLLWEPIEQHFNATVCEVYLAPTGLLHNISFYIMKDKKQQYISQRYRIRNVFSTRDLVYLYDRYNNIPPHSLALLLGGAKFSALPQTLSLADGMRKRGDNYEYLSGSDDEVRYIDELLRKQEWEVLKLADAEATKENFERFAALSPALLHIATHGYHKPLKGWDSYSSSGSTSLAHTGFILAGYNRKEEVGSQKVTLTAQEIAALDFSNTRLAVLSACNSGIGDISNNDEGVYGLKWAFRLAGAQAMIVTLWEVSDYYTLVFMKEFYSEWMKGMNLGDAFAMAQDKLQDELQLLKQEESEMYWGGFVLIE